MKQSKNPLREIDGEGCRWEETTSLLHRTSLEHRDLLQLERGPEPHIEHEGKVTKRNAELLRSGGQLEMFLLLKRQGEVIQSTKEVTGNNFMFYSQQS